MHIEHYEKHFRYNDRELLLIARKVGKLATFCKRVKDEGSKIVVQTEGRKGTKKQRDRLKMSITVELPGKVLRAESRKSTVTEAVDRCIEKLEPQLKRYKEKHSGVSRKRNRKS